MASSFSILDHLHPYLAILSSPLCACLGHRRHSHLLHSPVAPASDLPSFVAEERHSLLPESDDALSLHSVTGQAHDRSRSSSRPLNRTSRWQLCKSWWSRPQHNRSFVFDNDDDAELLPEHLDDDSAVDSATRDRIPDTGTIKTTRHGLADHLFDLSDLPSLEELNREEEKLAEVEEGSALRGVGKRSAGRQTRASQRQLSSRRLVVEHSKPAISDDTDWQEYQSAGRSLPAGHQDAGFRNMEEEDEVEGDSLPDLGDADQLFSTTKKGRKQGRGTQDDRSSSSYDSTSAASSGASYPRNRQRRRGRRGNETTGSVSTAPTSVRASDDDGKE